MSNQNKTIRIRCNPKDPKNLSIDTKVIQNFEKIDILSLTLKQSDLYRTFNSPVGVLIGRVNSSGVGVPNVKVSIFIEKDDSITDPEILAIYPFKSPQDKDSNGKRYNLLNKLKRLNVFSGYKENNYSVGYKPKTAVGNIPDKVELISNDSWIEVYEKYYKFTTVTNQSGDYMIFGIPVGIQQVHMDCDISDVGKWSSSIPIISQLQGISADLFNSDGTKIKPTNDLDSIPTIQSQNISVNVIPLWGDSTYTTIGITRNDFEIRTKLNPHFTIAGSSFTQADQSFAGDKIVFRSILGFKNLCIKIGNCDPNDNTPGISFKMGLYVKLTIFGKKIFDQCFGNCDNCSTDKAFNLCLCIKLIIQNIIPFFCVSAFGFQKCQVNGGQFDQEPISIKYLGSTSVCGDCDDIKNNADIPSDEFTEQLNLDNCRVAPVLEKVFYYKSDVLDGDINSFNTDINNDIGVLQINEYAKINSPDGSFLYQIVCNRRKIITSEQGDEIEVESDSNEGLFSEFFGYIIFSLDGVTINTSGAKISAGVTKIKVPQCEDYNDNTWVKSAYKFKANNLYSVAQFYNVSDNVAAEDRVGLLIDVNTTGIPTDDDKYGDDMEMQHNNTRSYYNKQTRTFENQWQNGTLYFLQAAFKKKRGKKKNDKACGMILGSPPRTRHSTNPLGAGIVDNYFMLNGYYYQTNFIEINKDSLIDVIIPSTYRGIKYNTDPNQFLMNTGNNSSKYFYRGLNQNSDAITNFVNKDIV